MLTQQMQSGASRRKQNAEQKMQFLPQLNGKGIKFL